MEINRICPSCMNGEIVSGGVCKSCGSSLLMRQTVDYALPLQTILHGRYLLGRVLGQGGFGITYVAYDLINNKRVVIKELFPVFLVHRNPGTTAITSVKNNDSFRKYCDRFIEEAQMLYTFRDTREIVDVYHVFTENQTAYYSMQYLDGQTLQAFRKENGNKIPWIRLKPIVSDIINALRVVHKSGSIHRDISPDNVFLTKDGLAKLIDFGSARYYKTGKQMTKIIKKGFAPWEQYQSDGICGPWTDIYALAATIYVCLTGGSLPDATSRAIKDTLVPPNACGANVPPGVNEAIVTALNIYPRQRFQNADAFADALQLNAATPTEAPNTRAPENGRWQLRCIRGVYAGMRIPFASNIIIGRDPTRCTLVFPSDSAGISRTHLTLLYGKAPYFPGVRCESASQTSFINGEVFSGYGRIQRLETGDRISFGDNQIFIIERIQ